MAHARRDARARVPRRADARGLRRGLRARGGDAGATRRRRPCWRPTDVALPPAARLVRRRRRLRRVSRARATRWACPAWTRRSVPDARAIGELALPRLAGRRGRRRRACAAAVRAPSRRADDRRARRRRAALAMRRWRRCPSRPCTRRRAGGRCAAPTSPYVAALEAQIHAAPWTPGNFRDALAAGYGALVGERDGRIVAYGVLMLGAGRGAAAQPVRRAGRAPRGPRPRAARSASCDDARAAGRRAGVPRGARGQRGGDRALRAAGFVRVARRAAYYPPDAAGRARGRAGHAARVVGLRIRGATATRRELGLRDAATTCCASCASRRGGRRGVADVAPTPAAGALATAGADRVDAPAGRTRAAARIATLDWDEFAADVDACTACGLCRTRNKSVPGVGDRACGVAVRRRGAGRRGGCARRAVRGPGGPAARQHAGGARHERGSATSTSPTCSSAGRRTTARPSPLEADACRPYLERQIALIAAEADRRARQERRVAAARHRRDDRQPARARPPLPRRAAGRHLSSGLPAAQPAGQGEGVGGPAVRAARPSREAAGSEPQPRTSPTSPATTHRLRAASLAPYCRLRADWSALHRPEDTC